MKKSSYVTITDQFCGAGGSSSGAVQAGKEMKREVELRLALNHWKLAIETHSTNFPNADHECVDISATDPRRYASTSILITSPECTNHGFCKGVRRKYVAQRDMFVETQIDAAAVRSRVSMMDVPRFAEFHQYEMIVVENVIEVRYWVLWEAWIKAMELLDYEYQIVSFNSMFAHPTPQSRDRLYVVFWKKGRKRPDLSFNPKAFCAHCEKNVSSRQIWKNGKRAGRYRMQYFYACPDCKNEVLPYYYCVANIIDWTLPIQRIGDRDKPLKTKTIERIKLGIEKFSKQPFIVGNYSPGWVRSLQSEAGTITAVDHHALVAPAFIVETAYTHAQGTRSRMLHWPGFTQTGQATQGLALPFILNMQSHSGATALHEPINTILTGNHKYLIAPEKGNIMSSQIEDYYFRMLKANEIKDAMAFEKKYVIIGSQHDQIRQLGNAVTPPVMKMIMKRCLATFD